MDAMDVLAKAREGMNVQTVFGEPITHDGLVIIPAARISGGAGGGSGRDTSGENPAATALVSPIRSAPVGGFVVKDGIVTWRPSLDLNKIILGGQVVGIVALLTIGSIVWAVLKRRAGSD